MKANEWKALSLFAGAGGCSLGFKYAGIDMIAAFDNANAAIETYNSNFGEGKAKNVDLSSCNFEDIRNELDLKRGELDLIIGGPPCQGFTTAGNRFWDDPRNKLVQNYAQALEVFYPRWFEKMENEKEQIPGNIHLSAENGKIVISNSNGNEYEIPREMLTE